jgi:DNA-binding transcriptional regulator YhcF (GntR family)
LNISIDRHSKTPIQEQIKLEIAQRIRSGLLEENYVLPSVRQLSHCLNISLVTAHRVYKALGKDGLIKTIRGKGTFVKCYNTLQNNAPQDISKTCLDPYNWHLSIPDYLPRASFWSQSSVRLPPQFLDMATASIHHSLLPLTLLQTSIQQALQQYQNCHI